MASTCLNRKPNTNYCGNIVNGNHNNNENRMRIITIKFEQQLSFLINNQGGEGLWDCLSKQETGKLGWSMIILLKTF
jgi:hypothetical protein